VLDSNLHELHAVHDVGVQEGQVYIISDYLDGPDLGRWLRDQRPTWQEAARIATALAEALAHAHARRIVHRDVVSASYSPTQPGGNSAKTYGAEAALEESGNQCVP
jgi:serine/threonine protein kinase